MTAIRIYDLARELGKSNREIIDLLSKAGIEVKSHSSTIDSRAVQIVRSALAGGSPTAGSPPAGARTAGPTRPGVPQPATPQAEPRQAAAPPAGSPQARVLQQPRPAMPASSIIRRDPATAGAGGADKAAPAQVTPAPNAASRQARIVPGSAGQAPQQARVASPVSGASNQQARVVPGSAGHAPQQARVASPVSGASNQQARVAPGSAGRAPQQARTSTAPGARTPDQARRPSSPYPSTPSRPGAGAGMQRPAQDRRGPAPARPGAGTPPQTRDAAAGRAQRPQPAHQPAPPKGRFPGNAKGRPGGPPRYGRGGPGAARPRPHGESAGSRAAAAAKRVEIPTGITLDGPIDVRSLAEKLVLPSSSVIQKLMQLGYLATINQELDVEVAGKVAAELGYEVETAEVADPTAPTKFLTAESNQDKLVSRAPVVVVLGHVDHGKTSLLDAIRKTNVTAGEAGGITQHIGASRLEIKGKNIVFLDTPGHEAFTSLRARGARVTDIAVLVVAADEGVKPQTVEAVNHARAAQVPIIVAVNKMDRPGANPDRIRQQLSEYGLVSEDWGGDTIFVPVSAVKGDGIEDLLEMILLVAEMADLKANPASPARGTVVESRLDRGRGPVGTFLVQDGTLRVGDAVAVGNTSGKVRALYDDKGGKVEEVGPSTPVEVVGLSEVPQAGERFEVLSDERLARQKAAVGADQGWEKERRQSRATLDDLKRGIEEGRARELNLIVKADVQGSGEALRGALERLSAEEVRVNIVHSAIGAINESDILLAAAADAIVIGFNVRPEQGARGAAEREGVEIRLYRIIYEVIDEIQAALKGLLEPKFREATKGTATVRAVFKVSKVGTIAGSYVTEGKMTKGVSVRLIRDGVVAYEGRLDSLRRFKEDVREVAAGYECGIGLENFNDVKEGDVIEAYAMERVE
ncbi:MAG: translation initiation factor IF-2 [Firmicutes bacterium]|nr:translation initiation factor IF-2 [Bacillota bacterium]